ncbi:hypothetical protein C1C91_23650 (plasmid) [Aeromonas caviae]|uniref:Uncharacterized protein n=1 Tax=Aeromonas caviae TaxID=648 RepID=A0A7D5YUW3_AERCA|nr:hypothetical protein [Aeromonas caviae]QLI60478.1 hypothetical protein C1C91_23650 [Aeromonas caviae]
MPRQQVPGISSPWWHPACGVSSADRRTLAAPCGLPVQRLASPAGSRDLIALVAPCLRRELGRPLHPGRALRAAGAASSLASKLPGSHRPGGQPASGESSARPCT